MGSVAGSIASATPIAAAAAAAAAGLLASLSRDLLCLLSQQRGLPRLHLLQHALQSAWQALRGQLQVVAAQCNLLEARLAQEVELRCAHPLLAEGQHVDSPVTGLGGEGDLKPDMTAVMQRR